MSDEAMVTAVATAAAAVVDKATGGKAKANNPLKIVGSVIVIGYMMISAVEMENSGDGADVLKGQDKMNRAKDLTTQALTGLVPDWAMDAVVNGIEIVLEAAVGVAKRSGFFTGFASMFTS